MMPLAAGRPEQSGSRSESPQAGEPEAREKAAAYARTWLPVLDSSARHFIDEESATSMLARPMRHLHDAGGKRFRPLLSLAACELTGGNPDDALGVACAIEFFHTSSLILDDLPCMDDAATRRSVAAVHREYGEAAAILAALALFNLGHRLLASTGSDDGPSRAVAHARVAVALGGSGMIGAQRVDLALASGELRWSCEHDRHRLQKTAALISAALLAGASVGCRDVGRWNALATFGDQIGQAFQIADDGLDRQEDAARGASVEVSEQAELRDRVSRATAALRSGFPFPSTAREVLVGFADWAIDRIY
jgi:geranylgeranyl diphosphate synthase type II